MQAWSSIVYQLIPNVQQLESNVKAFADIIEADEVLLFEKATFLVISHCERKEHKDVHRFEKVSNIIKQFKLSCSKLAAQFQSMEVRNSRFAAFIESFTSNTFIMVVMSDTSIRELTREDLLLISFASSCVVKWFKFDRQDPEMGVFLQST